MNETKVLAIDLIALDADLQGREAIDPDHVADLRAAWKANGNAVPPLKVFFDGTTYWLADGYHRWHAAKEEKRGSVPCEVIQGSKREAWLDALKANQGHGLRRSNADKRKLVRAALNDPELVKWSDGKIADHIGVTQNFVSTIRRELKSNLSSPAAKTADEPKVGRDGKKRKAASKPKSRKKKAKVASQSDAPAEPEEGKISGGTEFNVEELSSEAKDAFGNDVPEEIAKPFELRQGFKEQRAKITSIKTWITQNISHKGAVILESAKQRIKSDLDHADRELKYAMPYCVCVYCKNKLPAVANCSACKGLGWITEPVFKQAPEEMRGGKA